MKLFLNIICMIVTVTILGSMVFLPYLHVSATSNSVETVKKINVYESNSFNYKCIDGKTVHAKGIDLEASKSGSSFTGSWKIHGENGGLKSGSITSGKVLPKDKEELTPVSFQGPIKIDTLCAKGSLNSNDQTMEITTFCFGDDDVYVTFKSGTTNKDLAHVGCQ